MAQLMRKGKSRKRASEHAVEQHSLAIDGQTKQPGLEGPCFQGDFAASSNLFNAEPADLQPARILDQAVYFPEPTLSQWMS